SEIYPEPVKMKKQMSYADSLKIPFVVLVGEEERTRSTFTLKDMQSGQQEELTLDALISHLSAQH
ncbi:MAG: histidine--tRNA ligase, partial [Porphyromonadaceae bacterium]|nr:histidine--tRNA ligase [Porphyromonadaceae bacterium]